MGHIPMNGTSTFWLGGHTIVLGKPLHRFFRIFLHTLVLWWPTRREFVFGKIYSGEINILFTICGTIVSYHFKKSHHFNNPW